MPRVRVDSLRFLAGYCGKRPNQRFQAFLPARQLSCGVCLSVRLSVRLLVCLPAQNVENYWSEIDITWQDYAPWWTPKVFESWWHLTFKPESYFRILGCIECMRCRLLLPMGAVSVCQSVRQFVCHGYIHYTRAKGLPRRKWTETMFIFIHRKGSRTNCLTNLTKQQTQYIYIGSGCSNIPPPPFLTITSLKPHCYFTFLTLKKSWLILLQISHYRTIHAICLLFTCRFCSALITVVIH